jgi:formamidopyrimidine-DNA glycosylase
MPELPEVETTRRGLAPHLEGRRIVELLLRDRRLRWPVPEDLPGRMADARVTHLGRRAKYLLLETDRTGLLLHLGMSGSLRRSHPEAPLRPHDHLLFRLEDGAEIRFHDPRRFGCCLPLSEPPALHPLLRSLGPEPLADGFDGEWLHRLSRGRRAAVKAFIMDQRVVVGVGNIYATEALFLAGIRPGRAAGRVTRAEYGALVEAIRQVLEAAIREGGTTLRDFVHEDGSHGYFRQRLRAYGREGETCLHCGTALRGRRIGQRASVYCPNCQR